MPEWLIPLLGGLAGPGFSRLFSGDRQYPDYSQFNLQDILKKFGLQGGKDWANEAIGYVDKGNAGFQGVLGNQSIAKSLGQNFANPSARLTQDLIPLQADRNKQIAAILEAAQRQDLGNAQFANSVFMGKYGMPTGPSSREQYGDFLSSGTDLFASLLPFFMKQSGQSQNPFGQFKPTQFQWRQPNNWNTNATNQWGR